MRPLANDRLEIRHDPRKGRGVYARAAISAGTLIETAPVVIVPAAQRRLLDSTILHDYYFVWEDHAGVGETRIAVALGLVSLCNHSRRPSARVRRNSACETLDLLALTPIAAGREITIELQLPALVHGGGLDRATAIGTAESTKLATIHPIWRSTTPGCPTPG